MACQPTDPCYNNACDDCNALIEPCLEVCTTPIYTEIACLNPINDNCVSITIPNDVCLDIVKPLKLNTLLNKLILFVKGFYNNITSTSLKVTTVPTACGKNASIELVPSTDIGNILVLGNDGYPYVPNNTITTVTVEATNTVNMTGNGSTLNPIKSDVKLNPSANNLTITTPTGLLTENVEINDIKNNLTQHVIFEKPPIKSLTYIDGLGNTQSRTKVFISAGSYANNYTLNNSNVKVLWGDNPTYENSLDNEIGVGNSLSHDYLTLQPESSNIEVKTYNGVNLNQIRYDGVNTPISGFKFLKGASLITGIDITAPFSGTTGVFDFKNMFNVTFLALRSTNSETFQNKGSVLFTLKNTEDLHSLEQLNLFGAYNINSTLNLTNPSFNYLQLVSSSGIENIIASNKPNLKIGLFAASTNTLDLNNSILNDFTLFNCGRSFATYVNNIIFKLTSLNINGQFDFTNLLQFTFLNTNGIVLKNDVYNKTYGDVIPTKFFLKNILNNNKLELVSVQQDWVKDEIFISLDQNALTQGFCNITSEEKLGIGLNYESLYYNPIWAPLNGTPASIKVMQTGGIVISINSIGIGGRGYNSIPNIITTGPGIGLNTTQVMQLSENPQNITSGGTGYVIGNNYNLTGAGIIINPIIQVLAISMGGVVTQYIIINAGEFTSLPLTLTHIGGLSINTTNKWSYKYSIINNGGSGYTPSTIFKLEVSTNNGTGTGTASTTAKAAIGNLHNKGWVLQW